MKVEHFDLLAPVKSADPMWDVGWHGGYRLSSISKIESLTPERQLEIDCFLSVLKDINRSHVNLIELGAGWGEWGIALHGTVKRKLVNTMVRSFNYLAIEGEPFYCELIMDHFEKNVMAGCSVSNCAVSDKDGHCYFDKFSGHQNFFDTWLTQGMTFGNVAGSRLKTLLLAGYRVFRGEVVKVPMHTLDYIVKAWDKYPDMIHMDVEGVEAKVIRASTIRPTYWIIGTHHKKINEEIHLLLDREYDCIVDVDPVKQKVNGLGQDGLQLWRKK